MPSLLAAGLLILSATFAIAATGRIDRSHTRLRCIRFGPEAEQVSAEELLIRCGFREMVSRGELQQEIGTHGGASLYPFGTIVRFRQYYRGLPVVGGQVVVRIGADGRPQSLFSSVAEWCRDAAPIYVITSARAIEIALGELSVGRLRGDVSAERVVLPQGRMPIFCWRVDIPAGEPIGDWEVMVDGSDGEIVRVEDRLCRLNAAGLVFDPDPLTATGDTTLRDEDDAAEAIPDEAYSEVELPDISIDQDSLFVLTGPWVDTSPTEGRARMDEPHFAFDREDDRFEEVMAYYHIDRQARYIRQVGFEELPPDSQQVNVNGVEDDLSFFSPRTGIITTGSGGVDDGEDADVLLHEYGHALLHRILPDWRGGDTGLLSEGLCDYLAGDYSLQVAPDFQPMELFNWDGSGEFWDGRVLNADYRYPEDANREPHDAGQLWSALLTKVRLASGDRDLWNRVVIDHLFGLGDSALVPDAAEALLASDGDVAAGRFRPLIVLACEGCGIFPPGLHSPQISHRPLRDIEDVDANRPVTARITAELPLDPDRLWLIYLLSDEEPDTLPLEPHDDQDDLYQAVLPAPQREADIEYYLFTADTAGVFSTHPAGAPLQRHRYHAGHDRIPPVIAEVDSLPDTVFPRGEMVVSARVTDNLGVADVTLFWYRGRMEPGGRLQLEPVEGDRELYVGRLCWDAEGEDVLRYVVSAVDSAAARNAAFSRIRSFEVVQEALIDDFERPTRRWRLEGWLRSNLNADQGEWSLADRAGDDYQPPRSAVAEQDETWDFSPFDRARLIFWESHQLDSRAGEVGLVEVSEDGGESWHELLRLTGTQEWWAHRRVELTEYCLGQAPPVTVRFRTHTPAEAEVTSGWVIDELTLSVGNIVAAPPSLQVVACGISLLPPYPNPVNDRLTVAYRLSASGVLELIDIAGRTALELPLPTGEGAASINLNRLATGVYLVRLSAGPLQESRQIVLVK